MGFDDTEPDPDDTVQVQIMRSRMKAVELNQRELDSRLDHLESEKSGDRMLKRIVGWVAGSAALGMVSATVMLVTTNQRAEDNATRINQLDQTQRQMSQDIVSARAAALSNGTALRRLEEQTLPAAFRSLQIALERPAEPVGLPRRRHR